MTLCLVNTNKVIPKQLTPYRESLGSSKHLITQKFVYLLIRHLKLPFYLIRQL